MTNYENEGNDDKDLKSANIKFCFFPSSSLRWISNVIKFISKLLDYVLFIAVHIL